LEDDFCFEANPDYGFIEIESRLPKPFHYIHLQRDLGINDKLQVVGRQGSFLRIRETPYCTTGYIVERSLAKYILAHEANCRMQIDHLYAELSHRGQFYQPQKPLIARFDLNRPRLVGTEQVLLDAVKIRCAAALKDEGVV
jgi:glycosyl transferase, family 25